MRRLWVVGVVKLELTILLLEFLIVTRYLITVLDVLVDSRDQLTFTVDIGRGSFL